MDRSLIDGARIDGARIDGAQIDCTRVDAELVGFHFGGLEPELRAAVEEHLLACGGCLRAYLAVKRATESADAPAPSQRAHARLRAAVAGRLDARRAGRRSRVTMAVVAVAAAVLLVGGLSSLWLRAPRRARDATSPASFTRTLDDSARLAPASLEVM